MIHRSHFSEQTAVHCLCMYVDATRQDICKQTFRYILYSCFIGIWCNCTCEVELPLAHFYMHYDDDLSI